MARSSYGKSFSRGFLLESTLLLQTFTSLPKIFLALITLNISHLPVLPCNGTSSQTPPHAIFKPAFGRGSPVKAAPILPLRKVFEASARGCLTT
jgi:hypothetical protein